VRFITNLVAVQCNQASHLVSTPSVSRSISEYLYFMSDIIKVRLQTTSQYSGAIDAGTQIFRKEGPAAFYKGTLTPLVGIGACVSSS